MLGDEVVVVVGRIRHSREQNLAAVKEAVRAVLNGLGAPMTYACELTCPRCFSFSPFVGHSLEDFSCWWWFPFAYFVLHKAKELYIGMQDRTVLNFLVQNKMPVSMHSHTMSVMVCERTQCTLHSTLGTVLSVCGLGPPDHIGEQCTEDNRSRQLPNACFGPFPDVVSEVVPVVLPVMLFSHLLAILWVDKCLYVLSFSEEFQGGLRCSAASWKFSEWLTSSELGTSLAQFVGDGSAAEACRESLSDDMTTEARCKEAFTAVKHFEDTHRLSFQVGVSFSALTQLVFFLFRAFLWGTVKAQVKWCLL